jgi:hypothetical protein
MDCSYLKIMYSGNSDKETSDWSPWLDFNQSSAAAIPKLPGVYKMHTSMKILYIGSAQNLRQSLLECISDPCIKKAKRFSYLVTNSADKVKEQLMKEYQEKHDNKLPLCMQKAPTS